MERRPTAQDGEDLTGRFLDEFVASYDELKSTLGSAEAAQRHLIQRLFWIFAKDRRDPFLDRYRFTHREPAPEDVECAIDPEMLGRVLERLADRTERRGNGSFYTPRGMAHRMSREALKGWLSRSLGVPLGPALDAFVDAKDPNSLIESQRIDPIRIDQILAEVRVCDPACGTGAFLLGALRELCDLREALSVAAPAECRLHAIESSLYGVDKSPLAVEVAKLRLRLAALADGGDLCVDHVRVGDSLSGGHPSLPAFTDDAFDWRVEFPAVFAEGGFDIVLANPPYMRADKLRQAFGDAYKRNLEIAYPRTASCNADLLVYFVERSVQLLRPGGQLVVLTSNKWLQARYGEKLRAYLSVSAPIRSLIDLQDQRVFTGAAAYPLVTIAEKADSPVVDQSALLGPSHRSGFVTLGEYVRERVRRGVLTGLNEVKVGDDGRSYGKSLPEGVRIVRREGVFVVDGRKRAELVQEDPRSAEILKPFVTGRGLRRWRVECQDRWLVFAKHGIDIDAYPAIRRHLERYRDRLEPRPRDWNEGRHGAWLGRKPGRYRWYEIQDDVRYESWFKQSSLIYQAFQVRSAFALRPAGVYGSNATFILDGSDLYLLGILNSTSGWKEIERVCPPIVGGRQLIWSQFRNVRIPMPTDRQRTAIERTVLGFLEGNGDGAELDARVTEAYFSPNVQ